MPHQGLTSGDANVAIRPQSICLSESRTEGAIAGTILKASYLGDHMEYTVDCALGELFVIDYQMETLQDSGSSVYITFLTRGVSLVPES